MQIAFQKVRHGLTVCSSNSICPDIHHQLRVHRSFTIICLVSSNITMIPSIDKARCAGEEIILLLKHHLPPELAYLWLGCDDYQSILERGGIKLTRKQISDCIRAQTLFTLESNNFRRKNWFALHDKKLFPYPKLQLAVFMTSRDVASQTFNSIPDY